MRLRNPVDYLSNPDAPKEVSADAFFLGVLAHQMKKYGPHARIQLWLKDSRVWTRDSYLWVAVESWIFHRRISEASFLSRSGATVSEAVNGIVNYDGQVGDRRMFPEDEAQVQEMLRLIFAALAQRYRLDYGYAPPAAHLCRISIGIEPEHGVDPSIARRLFDVIPYYLYYSNEATGEEDQRRAAPESAQGETLEEALLAAYAGAYGSVP